MEFDVIDIRRWGSAFVLAMLLLAGPARAAPEVGWWWNPNESGRGFFVESLNGIMYLAGYFYEADGRATWLVSGGPNTDSYNYQGRLLAYGNGQTLGGDYKPPATPTDAGPISISFSDDTHGSIVWPGGTIPIVRQLFGAGEAEVAPESGWWWNDAESGRGYSIEVQGDKLFAVAFMYDAAGSPVWYYSAGTMTTPTTYAGPWLQFAGGQTLTGAYRPPGAPAVVGQLGIEFTTPEQAMLTIDDTPAANEWPPESRKADKMFTIKRQFNKPKLPRPERWTVGFVIEDKIVNVIKPSKGFGQTQIFNWKWTASDVQLELTKDSTKERSIYALQRGVVVAELTYFQITSDNKEMCETKPGQNWVEALGGDTAVVLNDRDESYGIIDMPLASPNVYLTCTVNGKEQTVTRPFPIDLYFHLPRKAMDAGVVQGKVLDRVIVDYDDGVTSSKRTISARWSFAPTK